MSSLTTTRPTARTRPALEAAEIEQFLPHRWPFSLIDRVSTVVPGSEIVAVKCISASDPILAGHFPGNPIYPGVMLIEAGAQAAGLLLAHSVDSSISAQMRIGYLVTVRRFKFRAIVTPGDTVVIEAKLAGVAGPLSEYKVVERVGPDVVAEGELSLALA